MKVSVLDRGYVELVDFMGSDERIVESARMSVDKGFQGWGTSEKTGDERLLRYLWVNHHTSPFEQCEASFEVQAPIMVFREWMRHRTQQYNEMSGRYTQMPNIHYVLSPDRVKAQSSANKQGTGEGKISSHIVEEFLHRIELEQQQIYSTYEWALQQGIAKEVARINTPISRYSKMRAKANLLNWYRFLSLRLPDNAQYEIRQYAEAILAILMDKFPRSTALFVETKRV